MYSRSTQIDSSSGDDDDHTFGANQRPSCRWPHAARVVPMTSEQCDDNLDMETSLGLHR